VSGDKCPVRDSLRRTPASKPGPLPLPNSAGERESGGGAPRYPVWTAGGGDGAIVVDVGDCILQRRRRRRRPL